MTPARRLPAASPSCRNRLTLALGTMADYLLRLTDTPTRPEWSASGISSYNASTKLLANDLVKRYLWQFLHANFIGRLGGDIAKFFPHLIRYRRWLILRQE